MQIEVSPPGFAPARFHAAGGARRTRADARVSHGVAVAIERLLALRVLRAALDVARAALAVQLLPAVVAAVAAAVVAAASVPARRAATATTLTWTAAIFRFSASFLNRIRMQTNLEDLGEEMIEVMVYLWNVEMVQTT